MGGGPGTAGCLCPHEAGVGAYPAVWREHRCVACAMQALQGDAPEQALLASPVVDMEALITNMMQYAHVTEEQLQRAGEIPTDLGETLSWPYLCWVREHPLHWHGRTQVLYGDRDALTSRTLIERFRQESGAHLTIMEGGEHWFHTPVQMAAVQMWEEANL